MEAIARYLLHRNSNAHWPFPTSRETDQTRHEAREAVADLLGGDPDEVVFGASMTALTFHLSRALGRGLEPGDEIVVTELDHHGNVDPWLALQDDCGLVVRHLPLIPEIGALDLDRYPELLSHRTRIVALGAASNALGTLTDVRPLAEMAHDVGALVFVDAVHLAPHRRIRVSDLGCDFLACSPYKFYGPHSGVLWGRRTLLETMDVPKVAPAPNTPPDRLESGTANAEAMGGTTAAVDFLASLADGDSPTATDRGSRADRLDRAYHDLEQHEGALFARLWEGLSRIRAVRLYGPPPAPARAPTVSFTVERVPAREVSRRLAEEAACFLSYGDFYAATVVDRLGQRPHGLVRAGISCYTTAEEIDRLVDGVSRIAD